MLKIFSHFVARFFGDQRTNLPDPDGVALARLLFAQPDPVDLALLAMSQSLGTRQRISGGLPLTDADAREDRKIQRAQACASSELVFVAAPASMRKLREAGIIQKTSAGAEVAVFEGHQITFGGYADDVSFDAKHWGVEMRRFGPEQQIKLMNRALHTNEADHFDNDDAASRKSPAHAVRKHRL